MAGINRREGVTNQTHWAISATDNLSSFLEEIKRRVSHAQGQRETINQHMEGIGGKLRQISSELDEYESHLAGLRHGARKAS